ncbi:hypothetical protein HN385_03005 [archaeon]|jgi:hypothetical protein|nr:hypothetical protein [archaeon]MBT3450530.1 hypothetical protein [archaeon]MBT6868449.1 hypothetical protein [archaeon]MBT7193548.1 hypothetical protein [archaeon]MBT7381257.1 hypothetical protein [archaeon]
MVIELESKIKLKPLDLYPAIDGKELSGLILPVRSDIAEIIEMDDLDFYQWYKPRKEVAQRLLSEFELFSNIPHLGYDSEGCKYTMGLAHESVKEQLNIYRQGLEHIEAIKLYRDRNMNK